MTASRVLMEAFDSQVLANNPLGDPARRRLPVYLPPGYDDDDARRYPVVFLLAGYTGKGADLLGEAAWEETIQQRMDRLIASGQCRPMILVLPAVARRVKAGRPYASIDFFALRCTSSDDRKIARVPPVVAFSFLWPTPVAWFPDARGSAAASASGNGVIISESV